MFTSKRRGTPPRKIRPGRDNSLGESLKKVVVFWKWERSYTFFDNVNYAVWKGTDGHYYHKYVGRSNNLRFIDTRNTTLYWIKCFISAAGYKK